jgi:DNA-binding transcriptional LysR family regulator
MIDLTDAALFTHAVALGSLSAAGRDLDFSPAVASKRLARLEAELGVRLLQRSSRQLRLTEEGAAFHERCVAILAEVEEARAEAAAGGAGPRGVLRVTATTAFGRHQVSPCAMAFVREHPAVRVELNLDDAVVDMLAGGYDLAVRIGPMEDSRLISRRVAPNHRVVCASPEYLKRRGIPRVPEDLLNHDCLTLYTSGSPLQTWTLGRGRQARAIRVRGPLAADNGEILVDWALAGAGLAFKSIWDIDEELTSGRLVTVLDEYVPESYDIHLVYPSRQFLPAKTRHFIDALTAQLDHAYRNCMAGLLAGHARLEGKSPRARRTPTNRAQAMTRAGARK